jgi:phospholipid/cholesterol/gamma-HCH transport system substrate-binding protein
MKILMTQRERVAGAFVLSSLMLVIAFFVGAAIRNRWFHPRVHFHGKMLHGEGLREGSPISMSGVEVGEIGHLTILDDGGEDVELRVWKDHAHRVREGTRAVAKRLFGIGEKRIQLIPGPRKGTPLPPHSLIPIDERMDLLDAAGAIDLSLTMHVLDRTVITADRLFSKLDEGDRFDRMIMAFDRMGPTLERAEELLGDPNLKGSLAGVNAVVSDPATRKTLQRAAALMEPERLDRLLARTESVLDRVDALTVKNGTLDSTLSNANRLLGDGRADKLIDSMARLSDTDKLGRILDNTVILTEQLGRVGPEIPALTKEIAMTLREAVVVLKALQQTWILDDKAQKARRELEKDQGSK